MFNLFKKTKRPFDKYGLPLIPHEIPMPMVNAPRLIYPTDAEILKYICVKKGYITEEEWSQNKDELTDILRAKDIKERQEVEDFLQKILDL